MLLNVTNKWSSCLERECLAASENTSETVLVDRLILPSFYTYPE